MSPVGEKICFSISHYLLAKNRLGRYQSLSYKSESEKEFNDWRANCLRKSLNYFPHVPLNGKIVLDFGCGSGELSFLLKEMGAEKVYGVDLNSEAITRAIDRSMYGSSVEFLIGETSSIPLSSNTIDLVFCIAVLEHVMDVDSILREWYRILCPGGQILIHWCAWHHPDGSHLDSLIPIPYAQCLFSEKTLAHTARRVKASQNYRPKFWDFDLATGFRKEVCIQDQYTQDFLNKMSIGNFNKRLKKVGPFQVTNYECHPPSWFPQIRPLLKIPFCREHLTSFVTYILTKPARVN